MLAAELDTEQLKHWIAQDRNTLKEGSQFELPHCYMPDPCVKLLTSDTEEPGPDWVRMDSVKLHRLRTLQAHSRSMVLPSNMGLLNFG